MYIRKRSGPRTKPRRTHVKIAGVILETESSVRKIQKRALFHYKKIKRAPLI